MARIREGLKAADALLDRRPWFWRALLAALAAYSVISCLSAVGGNWFRSGNDMDYILPALRAATPADARHWLTGPWIGKELFPYYRPVTSLVWYGLYRLFGAESSAPYQALSVALHAGSVVLLALLLRRIFGTALGTLCGALLWAGRDRMLATIEWTPAQTDLLAGFFALAALLLLQTYLDAAAAATREEGQQGAATPRRALLLAASAVLALLAMGSKEVALTVPLLGMLLALRAPGLSRRQRVLVSLGTLALLAAFVGARSLALGGLGFLPGHALAHRAKPARLTPGAWAHQMEVLLLPQPLSPHATMPPLAAAAALAVLLLAARQRRWRYRAAILLAGTVPVALLMGGPEFFLLPNTYLSLAIGVFTLALIGFTLWRRPRDAAFVLLWGLIACQPLYHIVYNQAGNVTYLPDTYWALGWACFFAALLSF